MLLVNGMLDHNELYVHSKALYQQQYKILNAGFDKGHSNQILPKYLTKLVT